MKKLVIGWGIVATILGVQLAAFYGVENSRGRKAWAEYQKEALAQGDRLDIADFIRPSIPDEENFAAAPFFKPIFKGRKEAEAAKARLALNTGAEGDAPEERWSFGKPMDLAAWSAYLGTEDLRGRLATFKPVLDEIAVAGLRPQTRFPLNLEEEKVLCPAHPTLLKRSADLLGLRAKVALAEKDPKSAMEDLLLILRLAEASASQPFLALVMAETLTWNQALGIIWEGLAFHQWEKPDLVLLKDRLRRFDLIANAREAMLGERGGLNFQWKRMRESPDKVHVCKNPSNITTVKWLRYAPSGWGYQNQVTSNRAYKQYADALNALPIQPEDFVLKHKKPHVYHAFASKKRNRTVREAFDSVFIQNGINQALVACALEEYRLDHGALPETLEALVPQYLNMLPVDPMTAKSHIYRLTDNGSYLLYSIGWNGKDDGGTVAMINKDRQNDKQGDWVWYGSPQ